jgi:hypothetical protein
MKFRKKPIVIEAFQITDETFNGDHPNKDHIEGIIYDPKNKEVQIITPKDTMIGNIGDWIIRGVEQELYICPKTVFEKTYEAVFF